MKSETILVVVAVGSGEAAGGGSGAFVGVSRVGQCGGTGCNPRIRGEQ